MDIYDNIDNFDEVISVTEIHNENKELKIKVERYSAEMDKLRRDYDELYINHENLLKNYTSMLLTAKAEIARKTDTIMMINKEKDQMFLRMMSRRNNGKKRKNNSINQAEKEFTNDPLNNHENVPSKPINKVLKENRFQASQFSSDEEDSVTKPINRDEQEHKGAHTTRDSRDVRHKLRDRHTERVNERDRHREKGDRERDYDRERHNRDYYQDRRRISPERHQRGRAPHRDFLENKYHRNKSRQRILRSPENHYDRSKSRDRRHPVEHTNEKDDHHSLKHKIEDSNDNACPKRRRVEGNHEVHRQVIKCTKEVPSCQSPDDYNLMEDNPNEPHIVKEIKATSTSHLDDSRQKLPTYVQDSDQQNEISLNEQNVEIEQIPGYELEENNKCNKISDGDVISETPNVYCHSESSNMSVESGEIVDNIVYPDSSQTSNVCNKLSYHQVPLSTIPDFDGKSYKISKRQLAKNGSSAQIIHGPSPVELLYKEFESSLGHSSKSNKPSHKKLKSENLHIMNDETNSSQPKESKTKGKKCDSLKKSIVEGDLELSDDNSDQVLEEVNKNKRHKTTSRKVTSDMHHKESKNENKCEDSTKSKSECSKDDKVKHKTKPDYKEKDEHEKNSKHKQPDKEKKPQSSEIEVKIGAHEKDSKYKQPDKEEKPKSSEKEVNIHAHEKDTKYKQPDKEEKRKSSEKEVKSDAHEKDSKHKQPDKEEKPKNSEKEVKIRHKSKDKSNKNKSRDSLTNKDNHETKNIHNDEADHQIKATLEKGVKNGHKSKDKSKEHVIDKNTRKTRSKDESKHINKMKSNSDTKSIPEKEVKGNENGRHEKNNRLKHKTKHEDTAIENDTNVKYDTIDESPTEDKIREIIAESCKKQSILEKENSKTKNKNIMDKMSDLFGDNSLITPEDLNIRSQSTCDIYSEFIHTGSPSDTQNPDDDLWNVATGAQTEEDTQKTVIKLRKVSKETKSHYSVSEVYKDFPVLSKDNPSITKENGRQSISSNNYKIVNKESEKHSKNDHKSSKDVIDSQKNTFSEHHTEARVENSINNDIAVSQPVDLSNVTNAQTVFPKNGVMRLEPEISQNEPDVVKTVIISTGVQQLGLLDNENCSPVPLLSTVNNSKDAIALATSTPERDISDLITSAVNSITNLSGRSSEENTPANHQSQNGQEDVDKPDIRIRIVRKGRRSLKK